MSVETFEGALKFCKDEGGSLFEPRDTSITEILYSLMRAEGIDNFWIGIHDKVNEGHFVYASDKSPIEWSKWSNGQPNSYGGDQDCVIVRNNQWDDRPCHDLRTFACVRDKLGKWSTVVLETMSKDVLQNTMGEQILGGHCTRST